MFCYFFDCCQFHELHELKAAKQLFYRRQSRLMPQNAAIIRGIREIRGQRKNNCEAIYYLKILRIFILHERYYG